MATRTLATFSDRRAGREVRICAVRHGGRNSLDVRVWTGDVVPGQWCPTKERIRVLPESAPHLLGLLGECIKDLPAALYDLERQEERNVRAESVSARCRPGVRGNRSRYLGRLVLARPTG